jgi:hippurate hydrolase
MNASRCLALCLLAGLLLRSIVTAKEPPAASDVLGSIREKIAQERENLLALYREFHASPELSFHEEKTSARLAKEMRAAGFEVTEKVGGWGVVCVLKNGPGKTVLVRTDMDGLPVEEQTGLPYASKVRTKDEQGREVSVMHACGHDFHMACWVGTARTLASMKDRWQGTLVFIGQPAEERGAGALAMIADGLFSRFPKPDLCIAMHDSNELPAGTLGLTSGVAAANADSIDLVVHGLGGHGAMPDKTKDPIVLASQIVLALQTIRSRELSPLEPSVVTVGSIHGGTKHNIIPDEVRLQLTVRTFSAETRKKTLDAIARIARGQAISAGIPEKLLPELQIPKTNTPMLINDPAIIERLRPLFAELVGKEAVHERRPMMGAEDFSRYGMTDEGIPLCMFWVGATAASVVREAEKSGQVIPSLHSPFFYADAPVALPVGTSAMSAAVIELMRK